MDNNQNNKSRPSQINPNVSNLKTELQSYIEKLNQEETTIKLAQYMIDQSQANKLFYSERLVDLQEKKTPDASIRIVNIKKNLSDAQIIIEENTVISKLAKFKLFKAQIEIDKIRKTILELTDQNAGSLTRTPLVRILGRNHRIFINGRSKCIKYKGTMITLFEARKLEKIKNNNT